MSTKTKEFVIFAAGIIVGLCAPYVWSQWGGFASRDVRIKALAQNLSSDDPDVRLFAVDELLGYGKQAKLALPALLETRKGDDKTGGDFEFHKNVLNLIYRLGGTIE